MPIRFNTIPTKYKFAIALFTSLGLFYFINTEILPWFISEGYVEEFRPFVKTKEEEILEILPAENNQPPSDQYNPYLE